MSLEEGKRVIVSYDSEYLRVFNPIIERSPTSFHEMPSKSTSTDKGCVYAKTEEGVLIKLDSGKFVSLFYKYPRLHQHRPLMKDVEVKYDYYEDHNEVDHALNTGRVFVL